MFSLITRLVSSRAFDSPGPNEGEGGWQLVGSLAELAYDIFLERGVLIQPVPISVHWLNPERFPRPGFLRNIARDGSVL